MLWFSIDVSVTLGFRKGAKLAKKSWRNLEKSEQRKQWTKKTFFLQMLLFHGNRTNAERSAHRTWMKKNVKKEQKVEPESDQTGAVQKSKKAGYVQWPEASIRRLRGPRARNSCKIACWPMLDVSYFDWVGLWLRSRRLLNSHWMNFLFFSIDVIFESILREFPPFVLIGVWWNPFG